MVQSTMAMREALREVNARRCEGRLHEVLGKDQTADLPWLFTAGDGERYVVKFHRTDGSKTAFNEAFFGRVARRLGLLVPEMVIISVPSELIEDDERLSLAATDPSEGVSAGQHIGVLFLDHAFDFRSAVLEEYQHDDIVNADRLPWTVVFDSWAENVDHNGGNWLLEPIGELYFFWVIDFGNCLRSPFWNERLLDELKDPGSVRKIGPHPWASAACTSAGCFDEGIAEAVALCGGLAEFADGLPQHWCGADAAAVITCLESRAPGLSTALGVR